MNFTTSKKEFFEALQKVMGVVPQKTTISILTCVLMDLDGDTLNMTGTDLEISITTSVQVSGQESGAAAIPAKILLEIVRELPDVPLHIATDNSNKMMIQTEKGEYKIATQPREDFPKISVEKGEFSFAIDAVLLGRMVEQTIFAVSMDELRPALTGINIELYSNEMRFVATDGHRLAKVAKNNFPIKKDIRKNLIVPTKTMNLLMKNPQSNPVKIQIGEDHIVFTLENSVVYSKLINGTFPNYDRVLPKDNDKELRVNRDLLIAALRRVSIFSSSLTHQVRLILSNNEITIRSEDIEFGAEAKEVIPAQFSEEALQIGYNSTYLMDVLRHVGTEEVVFELKDGNNSAIITPAATEEGESVLYLLMPIRISEEPSSAS